MGLKEENGHPKMKAAITLVISLRQFSCLLSNQFLQSGNCICAREYFEYSILNLTNQVIVQSSILFSVAS